MSEEMLICPECEEGQLSAGTRTIEITHLGASLRVPDLECYRCALCGTETVKPQQIRRNEIRIADARRSAQGLLSGNHILRMREHLGLSQSEAAELFGGGPNGFSKYERGVTIQSVPMDRLLRVAFAFPWIVEFLRTETSVGVTAGNEEQYIDTSSISLCDPCYTSKPLGGPKITVSTELTEASVISITTRKKVA